MFTQLRTRLVLGSLAIVAIVVALIAFILLERISLNTQIDQLTELSASAGSARELSLYVQYSARDASDYTLGHAEFRPAYAKHAALFAQILAELQRTGKSGVLDAAAQAQLVQIKQTRTAYDRAAQALFVAANANRDLPSAINQQRANEAWEQSRQLADQVDRESQALSDQIKQRVEERQTEIADANRQLVTLVIGLGIALVVLIGLIQGFVARMVGAPLSMLRMSVERFAAGDFATRVDINRRDEVGTLARAFNIMAATIQEQQSSVVRLEIAEAARAEAEAAKAELTTQLEMVEQQRAMIRALSVPVIPISANIIVMPLVGALDTERLLLLHEQALHALERTSARKLVLDITGVPIIDSQVAQGLLTVVQTSRLLGTQVILVGIRPEVAQALVGLGLELSGLRSFSDLQSALAIMNN